MADNVAITAGTGTAIAADEVTDPTLGSVKVQYVKLMDGTADGTDKLAVNASLGIRVNNSNIDTLLSTRLASGSTLPITNSYLSNLDTLLSTRLASGSTLPITNTYLDVPLSTRLASGSTLPITGSVSVVGGLVASGVADSGNPVKVGGIYYPTLASFASGSRVDLQQDVNGYLYGRETYQPSAEDNTVGVVKTEQRYNYKYVVADTAVTAAAGFVHSITFTPLDAAATAGTIFLYDQTSEAVPTVFSYYIPAAALVPVTVILDVSFGTAIYCGFTTTADVAATIAYR